MNRTKQDNKSHNNKETYSTKQNTITKIISFIIGCVIGGIAGWYQLLSWGVNIPKLF